MAHHYRARPDDLAQLGKDLVRRSHAHCELCGKGGRALAPHEVPPATPTGAGAYHHDLWPMSGRTGLW